MNSVWVALAVVMAVGFGFGLGYAVTWCVPRPPVVVQCPAERPVRPLSTPAGRQLEFDDTMEVVEAAYMAGQQARYIDWTAPPRPWSRPMNGAGLDRFALVPEPAGHVVEGERGMLP